MYLLDIVIHFNEHEWYYERYNFREKRVFERFEEAVAFLRKYSREKIKYLALECGQLDDLDMAELSCFVRDQNIFYQCILVPVEAITLGCPDWGGMRLNPNGQIINMEGPGMKEFLKPRMDWLEEKGYLDRPFHVGDRVEFYSENCIWHEKDMEGMIMEIQHEYPYQMTLICIERNSWLGVGERVMRLVKNSYDPGIKLCTSKPYNDEFFDLLFRVIQGEVQLADDFDELIAENEVAVGEEFIDYKTIGRRLEEYKELFLNNGIDYTKHHVRDLLRMIDDLKKKSAQQKAEA